MSILLELTGLVGLTLIITVSKVFAPVRRSAPGALGTMLGCGQCTGFWVGLVGSLVLSETVPALQMLTPWPFRLFEALLWGFAISLLSLLAQLGTHLMDAGFLRLKP